MASTPLEIVEDRRKNSNDFWAQSDDTLVSVLSKCHETVSLILKDAEHRRIKNALAVLDFERSLYVEDDNEPSIRSMTYGAIGSFQLALVHLTEKMYKPSKDEWTQSEEIPSVDSVINDSVPKEGEIVEGDTGSPDLATDNSIALDSIPSDNISTALNFCHSFPLSKRELIDPSENQSIPAEIQISPKDSVGAKVNVKKEEITKEEIMDDESMPYMDLMENDAPLREEAKMEVFDISDDSIEIIVVEKEGQKKENKVKTSDPIKNSFMAKIDTKGDKPSSRVSKSSEYAQSERDFDADEAPSMNNRKFESNEMNGRKRKSDNDEVMEPVSEKKERRITKRSATELECIECEYRSNVLHSWVSHLRSEHSTTPLLSGLVIRCECGHESYSHNHNRQCDSGFTVVRKGTGPIRRLNDVKLTPKCILCEKYPSTACGYIRHLYNDHHKTTLAANGIHLKCNCGLTYKSIRSSAMHDKECDGRQYSLIKITDE